jgi:hypothetical protein
MGLYSTLKIDALTVPIPGRVWNIKLPGKSVGFPMPEIFSTRIFLVIKYTLEDGIKDTYNWFINNYKNLKK